jgi:hypothetical protein
VFPTTEKARISTIRRRQRMLFRPTCGGMSACADAFSPTADALISLSDCIDHENLAEAQLFGYLSCGEVMEELQTDAEKDRHAKRRAVSGGCVRLKIMTGATGSDATPDPC